MTPSLRASAAWSLLVIALSATPAYAQDAELPMLGRWTGTIRSMLPTQDSRNAAGPPGTYSGSVDLQPVHESGLDMYVVSIRVSSNHAGEMLEWGVSMGRCGSKLIMLENANQLPAIETRAGGEGEIRHTVAFNMNARQTYQLGLFYNGHYQQNMVACANLKYDDRLK